MYLFYTLHQEGVRQISGACVCVIHGATVCQSAQFLAMLNWSGCFWCRKQNPVQISSTSRACKGLESKTFAPLPQSSEIQVQSLGSFCKMTPSNCQDSPLRRLLKPWPVYAIPEKNLITWCPSQLLPHLTGYCTFRECLHSYQCVKNKFEEVWSVNRCEVIRQEGNAGDRSCQRHRSIMLVLLCFNNK